MRPSVFCRSTPGSATDEHAIPKWAREAFGTQGELTVLAGKGAAPPSEPAGRKLQHLNVVFKMGSAGHAVTNSWQRLSRRLHRSSSPWPSPRSR